VVADFYLTLRPATQKISHVWKTGIQTTVKGAEKRSALYTWPRIKLYNDFMAGTNQKINYLKRSLFRYPDKIWGVPIWADKTVLTSQAVYGQKVLNVGETDNRHFYTGRQVVIINPSNFLSYEAGIIDSLTSNQITLTENLSLTWGAGSFVLPSYDCRVSQEQEIGATFQNIQGFSIEATEAFETLRTYAYSIPSSGADTYQGLDLFLLRPQNPLTYKYKRAYNLAQFLGLGYAYSSYDTGDNVLGLKGSWLRNSRANIWTLLNFFNSKQGRFQKFWIPTWSKDIVPTAAILSADTVINVENIEYNTVYLPNEVIGRYVYIQFPDGTYVCRKISTATPTTITLDSAIGKAVSADNLSKLLISFLILCRFDIDELEIEYIRENYGKAEMGFSGLVGEDIS
jgi:hypothetical protein